jgi:hypothetical protein
MASNASIRSPNPGNPEQKNSGHLEFPMMDGKVGGVGRVFPAQHPVFTFSHARYPKFWCDDQRSTLHLLKINSYPARLRTVNYIQILFILKQTLSEFDKVPSGSFCRVKGRLNQDDLDAQL